MMFNGVCYIVEINRSGRVKGIGFLSRDYGKRAPLGRIKVGVLCPKQCRLQVTITLNWVKIFV